MKGSLKKKEGSIFLIPLFLPDEYTDNIKSYASVDFPTTEVYAFGRLIAIDPVGGDLVEVFNYIGSLPDTPKTIISSGRMFDPLHVSLGFKKKRWRFIFEDPNYDQVKDSNYQDIAFVMGTPDNPTLWVGGICKSIDIYDCDKYRAWIVFVPTEVETMINNK